MAKQLVNVGTSVNKGDGDPLRTAFQKINDNFNELYASTSLDLDSIGSNMTPTSDGGFALGSATKQWSDLYVRDFIYIGGTRLQSDAQGNITVDGGSLQIKDVQGDIFADDSTKVFDSATQTFTGKFEGELVGTVAADDSTVLIDGVAGTINAGALTGALPAIDGSALTGISASSVAFSNITSKPTTLAGYGITDASGIVLQSGSTQSIDVVAADSTMLVDSVNGTLNAATLTGALPALDGSALTGVLTSGGDFEGNLSGSVFADDSTVLVDGVNGTLNSSALTKPIALADNEKIIFGSDNDLEIFHNSSNGNTIIENAGNLVIKGSNLFLQSATGEDFFRGTANGAVTLYYDDVAKIETTADGVKLGDNGKAIFGDDDDMEISHSGTNGLIKSVTGTLVLQGPTVRIQDSGSSQTAISASNGIATLLFENSTKLETSTDGVAITGKITGLTDPTNAQDAVTKNYVDTNFLTAGGALTGNSLEAVAVGAGVADGNDLTITGGDATETNSTGGDANITGGSGALTSGNVNIGTTQTVAVSIGASGVGTSIGGTLTANGNAIFNTGVQEKFATLTGSTGVTAMDCDNGQVFYLTGATGDITANFTNLGLTAEYATNLTVIINQGATPYEVTAVQIGGAAQTINWQGGSAPTGNANGIDSFSFTILNDGGSYVVLGQMVDFT